MRLRRLPGAISIPIMMQLSSRRSIIAISLLIWVGLFVWASPALWAQSDPVIRIEPETISLEVGETTIITVTVTAVTDLYGIELHMTFDPEIVAVADMDNGTPGVQMLSGSVFDVNQGFRVANQTDNETGELLYAFTLLAPATSFAGDGDLLIFEVQALSPGNTDLNLATVILASSDGNAIPATIQSGQLTVIDNEITPNPTSIPDNTATATTTPTAVTNPTESVATSTPIATNTATVTSATSAATVTAITTIPILATAVINTPNIASDSITPVNTATAASISSSSPADTLATTTSTPTRVATQITSPVMPEDMASLNTTPADHTPILETTHIQASETPTIIELAAVPINPGTSTPPSLNMEIQDTEEQHIVNGEEAANVEQESSASDEAEIVETRQLTVIGQQYNENAESALVSNESEQSPTNGVVLTLILLGVVLAVGLMVRHRAVV